MATMLIPRFSLRWLLGLTLVCSLYFVVLAAAVRGAQWAIALSVATGSVAVVATVQIFCFLLAWSLGKTFRIFRVRELPQSPFATARPAPQVLRPLNPD